MIDYGKVPIPEYLSYSQIATYSRCPMLWAADRCGEISNCVTQAQLRGIIIHEIIARFSKMFIEKGGCDKKELFTAFESVISDKDVLIIPPTLETFEEVKDIVKKLIENDNFDLSHVVEVEYPFNISIDGVNVVGRIDRIDKDDDGCYKIVDYKTGLYLPKVDTVLLDLELGIYALGLIASDKFPFVPSINVCIHNVSLNLITEVEFDMERTRTIKEYIKTIWKQITIDKNFRPNYGDACFQYGGCPYAHKCLYNAGRIALKNGIIDITSMSDSQIIENYILLETITKRCRALLKARAENGVVHGDNFDYDIVVVKRRMVEKASLQLIVDLMEKYNLPIADYLTISDSGVKELTQKFSSVATEVDLDVLNDALCKLFLDTPSYTKLRKREKAR